MDKLQTNYNESQRERKTAVCGLCIAICAFGALLLVGVGCSAPAPLLPKEGQGEVALPTEEQRQPPVAPLGKGGDFLAYKSFGEYFDDRFVGYHVAVDLEAPADTPVYAIADGTVSFADTVSGYGGVMVVRHTIDDRIVSAIYGHIDVASAPGVGDRVTREQQMAVLGEEGIETDSEREHLHFAMYEGEEVRLRGYETGAEAIDTWLNPVDELGTVFWEESKRASMLEYGAGEEVFKLDFELPAGWDIEYVPSIQALNLYTIAGHGTARERSQVLIRYFDASNFLTLQTVDVFSTTDTAVGDGYAARRYDIQKKPGVPDFSGQPSWRNARHKVTDFRGEEGYTRYYVVARNPALDEAIFDALLDSMRIIER